MNDFPEWWEEYGQYIEEKAVLASAAFAIGVGQNCDCQELGKIKKYLLNLIEEKYRTNSKMTAQDYREMLEYMAKVEKQNK